MFLVEDAASAHKALREAAGLGPEHFPLQAFVGMISDEVQQLRERGWDDQAIAELIAKSSPIRITAENLPSTMQHPSSDSAAEILCLRCEELLLIFCEFPASPKI